MACCNNANDANSCKTALHENKEIAVEESVKEYYGKTLQTRDDLKTTACALTAKMSPRVKEAMKLIHEEVILRNYGCGMPFPECEDGCNVLDLGSGTGRDAFVLSKLVGPTGTVVGVDMTPEQLAVANEYIDYHMSKFGYSKTNVEFKKGFLEDLSGAGIQDDFFDIIVSNCVINLCKDKAAALSEAFRVLKTGGEIFFSDIYSNKEIPADAQKDKEAWGECLSGALFWKDLHRICEELGFSPPILVSSKTFQISDERIKSLLGEQIRFFLKIKGMISMNYCLPLFADDVKFVSATYRFFKPGNNDADAASVTYRGTIRDNEDNFVFGKGILFPKGTPVAVDAQLANILKSSRYSAHFEIKELDEDSIETALKINAKNPFCGAESAEGSGCC
ncbi:unnamed protein product [Notodromas monacha]|uniref:Arsenite methyltransferase n=1 Tax=Notodromas monacha TaxID=399045 RepID=A0A7R9BHU9_9CRUS|nr:unnamed protein product [Notodromas monacha]CAG0914186.1 unnamed protein product [Notodromas monacha]